MLKWASIYSQMDLRQKPARIQDLEGQRKVVFLQFTTSFEDVDIHRCKGAQDFSTINLSFSRAI